MTRRRRHDEGQGLVEFALVLPVIVLVLLGVQLVYFYFPSSGTIVLSMRHISERASRTGRYGSPLPY